MPENHHEPVSYAVFPRSVVLERGLPPCDDMNHARLQHLQPAALRDAQLWGEVAALCRQGFVIDPYEGRVLIADYHLQDTSSSNGAGSLDAAHVSDFVEYAWRRWPPQYHAAWKLRAAHAAVDAARARGSAPQVPATSNILSYVCDAVAKLPQRDRQRLNAFVLRDFTHEWSLAATEKRAILDVRLSIVDSMGILFRALSTLDSPTPRCWLVAQRVWCDGSHPVNIARLLSVSLADILSAQVEMGALLACAVRITSADLPAQGELMHKSRLDLAIKTFQNEGRGAAAAYCKRHRSALLQELDDPETQLRGDVLDYVTANPELLAELYENILPEAFTPEAPPESSAYLVAVEHARQSSEAVGAAFAALADGLDRRMVDWHGVLPRVTPAKWYREQLLAMPSVEAAGPHGRALVEFGLVPETIAGIARSLQLYLDRKRTGHQIPDYFADDEIDAAENSDIDPPYSTALNLGEVVECVRKAAYAPVDMLLTIKLARWTLLVLAERPCFVPGYLCRVLDDNDLLAFPMPMGRINSVKSLIPLWTLRHPNTSMEMY